MVLSFFRVPEDTVLHKDDPEKQYSEKVRIETNTHLGQLKLFCNELGFLLNYVCDENMATHRKIFLYIGAGPGEHVVILAKMFPTIIWHLFDNRFTDKLRTMKNVQIFERYFTDDDVALYRDLSMKPETDVYLVSDIRNMSYASGAWTVEEELKVVEDMSLQASWVKAIKPRFSMLKFRLPFYEEAVVKHYGGEYVNYLDGIIYKQPWARNKSTETRLVVDGSNIRDRQYSFRKYESQMFYHNVVTRNTTFLFPLSKELNRVKVSRNLTLDNHYDSAYTISLLYNYFKRSSGDLLDTTMASRIIKILSIVSMGVHSDYF